MQMSPSLSFITTKYTKAMLIMMGMLREKQSHRGFRIIIPMYFSLEQFSLNLLFICMIFLVFSIYISYIEGKCDKTHLSLCHKWHKFISKFYIHGKGEVFCYWNLRDFKCVMYGFLGGCIFNVSYKPLWHMPYLYV